MYLNKIIIIIGMELHKIYIINNRKYHFYLKQIIKIIYLNVVDYC